MRVCTKCQIELRPYQNGVVAIVMASFGPYECYSADEWHCPSCGWRGIFGFGKAPFMSHIDADFESKLAKLKTNKRVIYQFWSYQHEKPAVLMADGGVED